MILPEAEQGSVPSGRLSLMLLVAAGLSLLVGLVWLGARDPIIDYWAGHYGNWRDQYLVERLTNAPQFFLCLGVLLLLGSLAHRVTVERVRLEGRPSATAHEALLGVALFAGVLLSLREWGRYGYPCWDAYCDRAASWATWVTDPSVVNFDAFVAAMHAAHTGSSVLPPILIGTFAAPGVSVLMVYQLLVALSWLGIAWTMVRIGRRHLGFDRHTTVVMCVLLFGHLGVMRSLVFPQTDPLSLLVMLLVIAVSMGLEQTRVRRRVSLFALLLTGFFTKLSFVPSFAAPIVAWFFPANGEHSDPRGEAMRVASLLTLSVVSCAFLLMTFGFFDMLTRELSAVYAAGGNFGKDNNPLRFAVAGATTVQVLPLVFWIAPEPWTGARRQIVSMLGLVILALVVMKTAFWSRYMLPINCMLTLLVANGVTRLLGRGYTSIICLALYVAGNALFLMSNLYA